MEFEKLAVLRDGASPNCTELSSIGMQCKARGRKFAVIYILLSTFY